MDNITRVVCIIFYDELGRILLHNRDDAPEYWALLGGGIEAGEHPLDAIKREMREEIGLETSESGNPILFLKTINHMLNEEKELELHLFEAKFPGFSLLKDSSEVKLKELQFFALEEAKNAKKLPFAELVINNLSDSDFDSRV
jgi:8-oxo-dGTP pyrophosphatase MutT (NUDIX family)